MIGYDDTKTRFQALLDQHPGWEEGLKTFESLCKQKGIDPFALFSAFMQEMVRMEAEGGPINGKAIMQRALNSLFPPKQQTGE
jgi:hypothetical protein